jgi:hypothetical protein
LAQIFSTSASILAMELLELTYCCACLINHSHAFSVATRFTVSTGKKVDSREECYWPSHACSLQVSRCGSNSILECRFLSKNAHRARAATRCT